LLAKTGYEAVPPSCWATLLNVEFARVPMERIAVKQTTTIKANMTAYSTAVGPSSEAKKAFTWENLIFMGKSCQKKLGR